MQHRTDDAPLYPSIWSFFGGAIEEGESPEQCLVREIKEEIDYDITEYAAFKAYQYEHKEYNLKGTVHVFLVPLTVPIEQLTLGEGQGMKLFTQEELLKLPLPFPECNVIQDVVAHFKAKGF